MKKRIISVTLVAAMIVSAIMTNMVPAASAEGAQVVESAVLEASFETQAGVVVVNTLPDAAAVVVLAGYKDGRMVFSEWADGVVVPIRLTVADDVVYDCLKVFCLDADRKPITDVKQVYPGELHTVKFMGNGDGMLGMPETQTVENGGYAQEPAVPTREGYIFGGWCTEAECENGYVFGSTPVFENITLYALWVDIDLDTDQDGLADYLEQKLALNPYHADTDGNGVSDCDEDADGDGLTNGKELELGSNPELQDSDMDELDDARELLVGSDIMKPDTDGDGANDGTEVEHGTDPCTYNESFVDTDASQPVGDGMTVAASVEAQVPGEALGTVLVNPVDHAGNFAISQTIPGYLGYAFEFEAATDINAATITFEYDTSLGELSDSFQPCIYYYNEETQELEELPGQIVVDGEVTAQVGHFSTYIMLNRAEYESDHTWRQAMIREALLASDNAMADTNNDGIYDVYDELIYDGILLPKTGARSFVGYNFCDPGKQGTDTYADYDGDGLLNGDEIQVLQDRSGNIYIHVISDPTAMDSDGDGYNDYVERNSKGTDPLKYTYDKSAINRLFAGEDFAAFLLEKQIDENAWDHMYQFNFSLLGNVADLTTRKTIYKEAWLEYLLRYSDQILEDYIIDYETMTYVDDVKNFNDELNKQIAKGIANLMVEGATDASKEHLNNLISTRDALKKELDTLMAKKSSLSKAEWKSQVSGSQLKVRQELNAKNVEVKTYSAKHTSADNKISMVGYVVSGVEGLLQTLEIAEFYAQVNANLAAIRESEALFEQLLDLYQNTRFVDADFNVASAAEEVLEVLQEEGAEFEQSTVSKLRGVISPAKEFLTDKASDLLKLTPYASFVLAVGEIGISIGTATAQAQSRIFASVYLANAAKACAQEMLDSKAQTEDPEKTILYLSHLAHLRLYGEYVYAQSKSGAKEHLLNKRVQIQDYAERLGIGISERLVTHCNSISNPNTTIRITDDLNYQNVDYNYLNGQEKEYSIYVNNELLYQTSKAEEITTYLEPGYEYFIQVVENHCSRGNMEGRSYYYREKSLSVEEGELYTVDFNFKYSPVGIVGGYLMTDGVTAGIGSAVVRIREGWGNQTGDVIAIAQYPQYIKLIWEPMFAIDLPEGQYTVEISSARFDTKYYNVTSLGHQHSPTLGWQPKEKLYDFPMDEKETYTFSGFVYSKQTMEVIADTDVTVGLYTDGGVLVKSVQAAKDGTFTISAQVDRAGTYYLKATANGYNEQTVKAKSINESMNVSLNNSIAMSLSTVPVYALSGQVTDGKLPVEGAAVSLTCQSDPSVQCVPVTTDANGQYTFNVPGGIYLLHVEKEGYEPQTLTYVRVIDAPVTAPTVKLKKPAAEFSVTHEVLGDIIALAAAQDAVGGIQLCNGTGTANWTVTGTKSISSTGDWFSISQTDNGNGVITLTVSVTGKTLGQNNGTITFTKEDGSNHTVKVYQKAHMIYGTVRDEAGPVENAQVIVWNDLGFCSDTLVTGADGTFSLPVYDAWYSITVNTEEYGEKTVDLTSSVNMCDVTADIYLALPNGTCGDDLTWSLSKDGVLNISGSGDMYDYNYNTPAPWNEYCEQVVELVVETGVTSVGNYAFKGCALTSMSLPTSLRTIGYYAFAGTGLTQAAIPEGVVTLGSDVFGNCEALVSVSIPSTVTGIGGIGGGTSLTRIEVSEENEYFCDIDGVLFSKDGTVLREYPRGREATTYQIPEGTVNMTWSAFVLVKKLVNLIVPESMTRFVASFSGCRGVARIYFYGDLPTLSLSDVEDATLYYIEGKSGWTSPTYTNSDGDVYNTEVFDPDDMDIGAYIVASGTCGADLTWEFDSTETLTIRGTGTMTNYTAYSALPWYEYRGSIMELVVEEGVESLSQYAFYYCYQLSKVTLPDSLKTIGRNAFKDCDIRTFTVPVGVTSIGAGALDCYNLTQIEVATGNEYFEAHDGVLFTKNKVTLIKYPGGRTGEEYYHYVIPDGVQSVAEDAFTEAFGYTYTGTDGTVSYFGLGSVTFPASVKYIAWQDYASSSSYLEDMYFEGTVPANNAGYSPEVEWDTKSVIHFKWDQTASDIWVEGGQIFDVGGWTSSSWTSPIGAVYQTVCDDAIATISGTVVDAAGAPIEAVEVKLYDQSGQALSVYALSDATGAYQFQIGTAGTYTLELTKAGYETYTGDVALNAAVSNVGTAVLGTSSAIASGTSGLAQWVLDLDGVLTVTGSGSVNDYEWANYREQVVELDIGSGITGATLTDSISVVNGFMYNGYDNLQTIRLSETVSSLSASMNGSFQSISGFEVDPANTVYSSVDGVLYSADGSVLIKYPAGKTDTSLTVPDGVASIEDYAFQYCFSLLEVELPDSLRSIGVEAFRGSGLQEAVLPSGLTVIEDKAFYNAYRLETVYIPDTLETMGTKVFDSCGSLVEFSVDEENEHFCTVDGVLFNSEKTILYCYPAGKSDLTVYEIPATVVTLENGIDNDYLTEIVIGRKVEDIGAGFGNCFKLESITVNTLNGAYASEDGVLFDKDKKTLLQYPRAKTDTSYTVPDTVVTIAESAFSNCDNLTTIYLPAGVDTIENNAFGYSEKLAALYFNGNVPANLARYAFGYSINSNLILYYVDGMTGWTTPTWTDAYGKTYNTMTFVPK